MSADPVDPVDVLRNPSDYLVNGNEIKSAWVRVIDSGHTCVLDSDMPSWSKVTRKPRKRMVKMRCYCYSGSTLVFTATEDVNSMSTPPSSARWTSPIFTVEVDDEPA